jgi:hypothetical protein
MLGLADDHLRDSINLSKFDLEFNEKADKEGEYKINQPIARVCKTEGADRKT